MFNKQIDIYNDIFLNILSQKYSPNTVLKERDLALKYRTSRTTIRAILQKLSYENKIIINPRSKTFVKKINLDQLSKMALEDPSTGTNPKKLTIDDMKILYEHSISGKLF